LLTAMIGLDRGSEIFRLNLEPTIGAATQRLIVEYRQTFVLALILSALLAIACSVRLARYRATRMERIVWPVFVLLFGLPAWVGFRFGRTWPILDACPTCNARVPKDQTECLACSKEFPAPIELGTEVFA
jgi:ABC-type dipeptide/oligopeptide/nickel transport system permease component